MNLDKDVWDYFVAVHQHCNTIEFTFDKKNSLYIPLFTTSIEHCLSIHVLDREELTGSAFALARPMIENYLRAMWVKYVLKEDQIPDGCEQLHFPKRIETLLNEVDQAVLKEENFGHYKLTIEPIVMNMHDFTHGGVQSIARLYGEDGNLSWDRSPEERGELLKLAILTSSLSYQKLTPFMECSRPSIEILDMGKKLLERI